MSSRSSKRRRLTSTAAAPPPPEATLASWALPSDLLLEIVARSDAVTLIRCAACCKLLRRDILSPAFIRRVCHAAAGPDGAAVVPPRLFGFVPIHDTFRQSKAAFSLAHPATPAAAHLSQMHLAPLLFRGGGGDLTACFYNPLTSRNGVVALECRYTNMSHKSGICVYDPMTGHRTFIQHPPDLQVPVPACIPFHDACVLLTASDGIGCSFVLLIAEFIGLMDDVSCSIRVQTMSSDDAAGGGGEWSSVTPVTCHSSHGSHRNPFSSAVVLGGSIHWLMLGGSRRDENRLHVLTYKVGAAMGGRIELPIDRLPESYRKSGEAAVHLASTADGRLAMLCREREGFKICVWLMSAGVGWAPHQVIDTEAPLWSMVSEMCNHYSWPYPWIQFESLWERSGVILFSVGKRANLQELIVLDIETKEMHRVDSGIHVRAIPFDVDLESRLLAMKSFKSSNIS